MRATAYGNGGGDRTYVSKLSPEWYKIINPNYEIYFVQLLIIFSDSIVHYILLVKKICQVGEYLAIAEF